VAGPTPILRNFPIVGRFRYWFEDGSAARCASTSSPGNDEERPFSRDQRRWVYAVRQEGEQLLRLRHRQRPRADPGYSSSATRLPAARRRTGRCRLRPGYACPGAKVLGGHRGRKHAFRPSSIVNTSAMSYGSLSSAAVEAINRGVKLAGAMQNTGEGGISDHHRQGGDLIWQIGTATSGAATPGALLHGALPGERRLGAGARHRDQAEPGRQARPRRACCRRRRSPRRSRRSAASRWARTASRRRPHTAFSRRRLDARLHRAPRRRHGPARRHQERRRRPGLLARARAPDRDQRRAPDFITIDGGEGGTGAAPLVFSDHVALPFKLGFAAVYRPSPSGGLHEKVVFIGSGKLGFPEHAMLAMALGCDMINVAREAMLAIGCIQAQSATPATAPPASPPRTEWLMGGLDPTD
jgi:hypothetical protein